MHESAYGRKKAAGHLWRCVLMKQVKCVLHTRSHWADKPAGMNLMESDPLMYTRHLNCTRCSVGAKMNAQSMVSLSAVIFPRAENPNSSTECLRMSTHCCFWGERLRAVGKTFSLQMCVASRSGKSPQSLETVLDHLHNIVLINICSLSINDY